MKKTGLFILLAAVAMMAAGCGDEDVSIDNTKTSETSAVEETSEKSETEEVTTTAETKESKEKTATTVVTSETVSESDKAETKADENNSSDQAEATYEMKQTAISQIDSLNTILAMFGGKGVEYDEADSVSKDVDSSKINFSKVKDEIKNLKSIEDLKNLMKNTLSEEEYNKMMQDFDSHFTDENGNLYMNTEVGRSYYQFPCDDEDKMIFTDVTDHSFTVKTKEPDAMYGFGYVYFMKNGDSWIINGYEYK